MLVGIEKLLRSYSIHSLKYLFKKKTMQLQSYYDEKIFSPANRSILTAAIKNCYKRIVSLVYCTNKAILTTYCIVALTYILYTVHCPKGNRLSAI